MVLGSKGRELYNISHQNGKRKIIIDSKVPAGMGYVNFQVDIRCIYEWFTIGVRFLFKPQVLQGFTNENR